MEICSSTMLSIWTIYEGLRFPNFLHKKREFLCSVFFMISSNVKNNVVKVNIFTFSKTYYKTYMSFYRNIPTIYDQ